MIVQNLYYLFLISIVLIARVRCSNYFTHNEAVRLLKKEGNCHIKLQQNVYLSR